MLTCVFVLQTNKNAHILALTDELGYITLFNTRKKFSDFSSYQENAGKLNPNSHRSFLCELLFLVSVVFSGVVFLCFADKAKISEWIAHENAVFDLCWIKVCLSLSPPIDFG